MCYIKMPFSPVLIFFCPCVDTPSITAKLINEQKEDKEKKNYEEKEKVKAENGFQDNYSVVVASGMFLFHLLKNYLSDVKRVGERNQIYSYLIINEH